MNAEPGPYWPNSISTGRGSPGISGGEARRVALVRVAAADADILLLDEPTNHLDLLAIEWLEAFLQNVRSAVCIVSHDRRLLSELTRSTVSA